MNWKTFFTVFYLFILVPLMMSLGAQDTPWLIFFLLLLVSWHIAILYEPKRRTF